MFWQLILAHFIGDYPLQPDWLVEEKGQWSGLLRHVAIHLAVMFVVSGPAWLISWPYLLAVALLHFIIDFGKNQISKHQPNWRIAGYFVDQAFHILTIWLVANWYATTVSDQPPIDARWFIYGVGYLLVTYVWFITERVIVGSRNDGQYNINAQAGTRMFARFAWLTALQMGVIGWFLPAAAAAALVGLYKWPYTLKPYGRRAMLVDISVVLAVWCFI